MEAASRGGMSYQQWNEGGHAQFVDPVWRAQVPSLLCYCCSCSSRRNLLPTGVSCCLFALLPLEVGVTYCTHSMFLTFLLTCKLAWAVAWA